MKTNDEAPAAPETNLFKGDWRDRLAQVVAMMREMSLQSDPQEMVRSYGRRMRELVRVDGFLAISRRGLEFPQYRVTRSSTWKREPNPWRERDRLPLLSRGLLAELIYGNEPRIIDDLQIDPADPAAQYLEGHRSLVAVPQFDHGEGLNMVVSLRREAEAFPREQLPEWVWLSSLFGRATNNLVLSDQLAQALGIVERELKIVADLQRSLLPKRLPSIPGLDLAAFYQTSKWAGGDYYDIFSLPDGRYGFLIADVSGHGTPAAVMMAVTHSIAHTYPGSPEHPDQLLNFLNHHLAMRYTVENEAFVTAFYGIYDPASRSLSYACAGHNPPRLKRCADGSVHSIEEVGSLPLGIDPDVTYQRAAAQFQAGDRVVFYTDGITESTSPAGAMFGMERLDLVLEQCHLDARGLVDTILESLEAFTAGAPAADDRTILALTVS